MNRHRIFPRRCRRTAVAAGRRTAARRRWRGLRRHGEAVAELWWRTAAKEFNVEDGPPRISTRPQPAGPEEEGPAEDAGNPSSKNQPRDERKSRLQARQCASS